MESPYIISFYTENTLYELEAKILQESCETLKLPYYIKGVENLGCWEINTAFKAGFIKRCLEHHKGPILWVDADGELLKKPTGFTGSIGIPIKPDLSQDHPLKISSSTLYFDYRKPAIEFLESWAQKCEKAPYQCEKHHLRKTLFERNQWEGLFNLELHKTNKPLIRHYEASRFLRKLVNKRLASIVNYDQITTDEWKSIREEFYPSRS